MLLDEVQQQKISRLEVIDQTGRIVVKYLKPTEKISLSLQDDGRTLKVFVEVKEQEL